MRSINWRNVLWSTGWAKKLEPAKFPIYMQWFKKNVTNFIMVFSGFLKIKFGFSMNILAT